MSIKTANPKHEVAYQELTALLNRHALYMTPLEVLAIAANMVGKIVALQDQRITTPAQAMEIVTRNIELGNAQVVAELMKSGGSA